MSKVVSFVIPCYYSEKSITDVVNEIIGVISNSEYDYEIILVNDGSTDKTMEVISGLQSENKKIVAIDLIRNFGQSAAQMAGFNAAKGDYVFSLDDDGQMPIESVIPLIEKLNEGYDVVFGQYGEVKQTFFRNIGSKINAKMTEVLIGKPKSLFMSSFWVARKVIIDEVIKYQGPYPYIGGLLLRTSKNMTSVPVVERERQVGTSNYTFRKLLRLWLNGFTAFSIVPLRIASGVGTIVAILGFVMGIITVIRKIVNPDLLMGYASLMSLMLLIGGVVMLLLGMIGEYLGRIYMSINQTPQFIVRSVCDDRVKGDK